MAAIAPTYLTGYDGAVKVDAVEIPITKWSGKHGVGTFDATNSMTGGNAHPERTIKSMNGSFEAVWPVVGGAPDFVEGLIYPLVLETKTGQSYTMNALIVSIDPTCDVKGGVTYTCEYMSQGAITRAVDV